MGEIKVSITQLDMLIMRLQELMAESILQDSKPPAVKGGGKTVQEICNMAETYEKINASMIELLNSTIAFLKDTKEQYATVDKQLADGIAKR